jgi:uncharacterized protein YdhG (YjbR/CyaY superfamily)
MELIPNEIDNYIARLPVRERIILNKLRQVIRKAVPDAEEVISYQMPAFRFHGMLVWYATFKNHYSVFVRPSVLQAFSNELNALELTKSAIKFTFDHPVPVRLITKIVKFGAIENLLKAQLKKSKK